MKKIIIILVLMMVLKNSFGIFEYREIEDFWYPRNAQHFLGPQKYCHEVCR